MSYSTLVATWKDVQYLVFWWFDLDSKISVKETRNTSFYVWWTSITKLSFLKNYLQWPSRRNPDARIRSFQNVPQPQRYRCRFFHGNIKGWSLPKSSKFIFLVNQTIPELLAIINHSMSQFSFLYYLIVAWLSLNVLDLSGWKPGTHNLSIIA